MSAKKSTKSTKNETVRVVQYLISGGAYFWSGYLMFFALDRGLGLSLWWAKLLANITGWTINYVLQRYWVFNDPKLKDKNSEISIRYAIITLLNFGLDYLIVLGLKNNGISPYIGQFVSSGFFTIWNYLWYKFWVFARISKPKRIKK